jgi:hypothetical protein
MKLPNFFIIGAPKSGTTALYHCLKQHPDIFMSRIKEPLFFAFSGEPPVLAGPNGTFCRRVARWRPRDYMLLFADSKHERVIGEASQVYLRTTEAAQRIKQHLPHSHIIAVLRQPADRAYSHYTFLRQKNIEPARSFSDALAHEATRLKEGWFSGFYHKSNGYYYKQLSTWYDLFPRQQIKVYLYEDWRETPQEMMRDIFRFLKVDDDFQPDIKTSNVTLIPKSHQLHRLAGNQWLENKFGRLLSRRSLQAIQNALIRFDTRFNLTPPPPMDHRIRAELTEEYRKDILMLQDLIGRDLSRWLCPKYKT